MMKFVFSLHKMRLVSGTALVCAAIGLALFAAQPVRAHHSFTAEFDGDKTFEVKGTITKVEWINPHIYFYLDVKDERGNVTNYSFETLPTGFMHKMGVTKQLLLGNPGDVVDVIGNPAKDATKGLGWANKITYPDGHFYVLKDPSGK
jgi:hypothetical protein